MMGMGDRYKSGVAIGPVRWVFVEDRTVAHRVQSCFTADIALPPHQIIEAYTSQWAIEVTVEGARDMLAGKPPVAAAIHNLAR